MNEPTTVNLPPLTDEQVTRLGLAIGRGFADHINVTAAAANYRNWGWGAVVEILGREIGKAMRETR